jgi:hypothetical protein
MSSKRSKHWLVSVAESAAQSSKNALSESERQELTSAIDRILKHLELVKKNVNSLPTEHDSSELNGALESLLRYVRRAEDNALLASALGLVPPKRGPSRPPAVSNLISRAALEDRVRELSELPTDGIADHLSNYKVFSMDELRDIARIFGIRADDLARSDLVDRIVKIGFANKRGYQRLRDPDGSSVT